MTKVLAKLPHLRSHWPYRAKLTQKSQFTLYDGNRVIGVVTLNPGAEVEVLAITQEHAIIKVAGHESPLPVLNSDIIDKMGGAEKILAYPDDSEGKDDSEKDSGQKK